MKYKATKKEKGERITDTSELKVGEILVGGYTLLLYEVLGIVDKKRIEAIRISDSVKTIKNIRLQEFCRFISDLSEAEDF